MSMIRQHKSECTHSVALLTQRVILQNELFYRLLGGGYRSLGGGKGVNAS